MEDVFTIEFAFTIRVCCSINTIKRNSLSPRLKIAILLENVHVIVYLGRKGERI